MISFDLKCRDHGHEFEGWFASAAEFAKQQSSGLLTCPICNSTAIEKRLSVPNVGPKSNQLPSSAAAPASSPPVMNNPEPLPQPVQAALAALAKAQAKALKSSTWVGDKFADEVRAQHYGERDIKPVHGNATPKVAAELAEEGINVAPIVFPFVPENERN